MGPLCVGKTSFKSLLFNWPAPKVHHSTALATRPVHAIERVAERNEGKIWERVTGRDLLKMLCDAIPALEQQSDDVNDSTLEKAATSTNFSSQSSSYVSGNSSMEIEAIQESNSSSFVKESYISSVDISEVHPSPKSSTGMPLHALLLSSDLDVRSSGETTTISNVIHTILNTASLPSKVTASPITQSQQSILSTVPESYSNEIVNVLAE